MDCKDIHVVYFSPTHTSAKIVHAVAEGMGAVSYAESDLTYEKPAQLESIQGADAGGCSGIWRPCAGHRPRAVTDAPGKTDPGCAYCGVWQSGL